MTAYQGGKKKIGKELSKIIKQYELDNGHENLDYLEPFCGMCGVLMHMNNGERKIIANDLNKDIILMWKAVQKGWLPENKQLSREEYEDMKLEKKSSKERGFYGVASGFNNEFLGSYRPPNNKQNYIKLGINNLENANIDKVKFYNGSYEDFNPKNMLIYCDPPYKNNTYKANVFFNFDHEKFWETMRKWSKNNLVIISEYNAPKDFKPIWSKKTNYNFNIKNQHTNNNMSFTNDKFEKLFIYKY